jgi:hypothetical protein
MKAQEKIGLIFVGMVFATLGVGLAFVFYVSTHQEQSVPRWVSLSLGCLILLVYLIGWNVIRRNARKVAREETPEESQKRRGRTKTIIKVNLVFYAVALLDGIRLVLQGTIPLKYAIVGITVVILLIASFWNLLRKLTKLESHRRTAS